MSRKIYCLSVNFENVTKPCCNEIRMIYEKLFNAEYTLEALEQFKALDADN